MLDIGWTELLLIGVVALIVVGPKDLPGMFRTLGRFTAKMRSMAREFQRAMEQAADESGVKDVAADLREATSTKRLGLDSVQGAAKKFKGGWKSGLDAIASGGEAGNTAKDAPAGTDAGSGKTATTGSAAAPENEAPGTVGETADEDRRQSPDETPARRSPAKGSGEAATAGAE